MFGENDLIKKVDSRFLSQKPEFSLVTVSLAQPFQNILAVLRHFIGQAIQIVVRWLPLYLLEVSLFWNVSLRFLTFLRMAPCELERQLRPSHSEEPENPNHQSYDSE